MKYLKLIASILIFVAITTLGYQVITSSMKNQKFKSDYAELNHFKYGLFSVDAWKEQLSVIFVDEIDKMNLTRKNKATMQLHLETQLGVLIDKVFIRIRKSNADSPMKQTIIDTLIDPLEIKKGIPEYADAIMKEMMKTKAEDKIKIMLKKRIDLYMKTSFDTQDDARKDEIMAASGSKDEEVASDRLQGIIRKNQNDITEKAFIIIGLAVLLFVLEGFSKGPLRPFHYLILTLTLIVMMIVGVTTPMIDMEAKITKLSFVLLDHPINFENQILYFQSKSILDVFWVMITHRELEMKLVGILVVGFSLVFPILKIISSLVFYYDYFRARSNKLIKFFVLKSGKWSMADVLVVAIFMAYIGFNGIINSQLNNMAQDTTNLELISTNGTNLQPGYYMFLSYTILAMFLANFLRNRPYVKEA